MRLIISLLALLLAVNIAGCANEAAARKVPVDSNRANAGAINSTAENPYTASFVGRDRPAGRLQPDPTGS